MKSDNGFKIIDLNGEGPNGEKVQVELTPPALAMIEKAHREATQARTREEALHQIMSRELAEREAVHARERRTIQKLALLGLILVLTVFGQILYIRSLMSRLGEAGGSEYRSNVPSNMSFPTSPRRIEAMPQVQPDTSADQIIA